MYENEIYSNSENGGYTSYQTGNSTYGTGSTYGAGSSGTEGKKKKGTFRKFVVSMGLGITFGVFAGAGFQAVSYGADRLFPAQNGESVEAAASQTGGESSGMPMTNINQVTYVSDDISGVVEEVMPAMVSVMGSFTQEITTFWGPSYTRPTEGAGSGIIVAENNDELLIVTNNHVVEGAQELKVSFIDGTTATARIKGLDSDMDLAVISVSLADLSQETRNSIAIARLGDSDSLKLGMPVIAIGNALGYGQSVTGGYISALNREVVMEDGTKGTFIQTDAAINSGNSGGALLTVTGEVIGINSSKIKGSGVEGMGYAIPISSASPIIADLMERRTDVVDESEMGYLGVTMQNVIEQVNQMYGIPYGVFIVEVEEDSPAQQAGIRKGDVIVKFDGRKISSNDDMKDTMQHYKAGETVKITVMRSVDGNYENIELEIQLGSRPVE